MRKLVLVLTSVLTLFGFLPSGRLAAQQIANIEDLDISKISQTLERPRTTGSHSAISIAGISFQSSIQTRAKSRLYIQLDGKAQSFSALGGIPDSARTSLVDFRGVVGPVEFLVYGDRKLLVHSGTIKQGDPAVPLQASLAGVHELELAVDGPDGAFANWVKAQIKYTGRTPQTVFPPEERNVVRVSQQPSEPRINGAMVVGIRPGTPLLYTIAATGKRPMQFEAKQLPAGLRLDPSSGIITGSLSNNAKYNVILSAKNAFGHAERTLQIVVGDKIALTPIMGWNSWNVTEGLISETVIEETANAMVADGLRDVGYQYIDLDDQWVVSRDEAGRPVVDPVRFPHGLHAVADYLHARGFKLGIYSTPSATTCGGYPGSLGYEQIDVSTWISWGIDLLKYDACSDMDYHQQLERYARMGDLLEKSGRSIVYSLSGPPAKIGEQVKAQLWRTAGDIRDAWHLQSGDGIIDCFDWQFAHKDVDYGNVDVIKFQHPGAWNDPDLLVVGIYGKGASADDHAAKGATDVEYRTQMSLWAMLSAPLLVTADLRIISPAALEMLTNPEVIDIDQDALGREPTLASQQGGPQSWPTEQDGSSPDLPKTLHSAEEVWSKDLADGSKALALLNRSEQTATITARWSDLGLSSPQRVRDLWQRKDIGVFKDRFSSTVPAHGTVLIRIWPAR